MNEPRKIAPLASIRKIVRSTSDIPTPSNSLNACAVVGPMCANQPVMTTEQRVFARGRRFLDGGERRLEFCVRKERGESFGLLGNDPVGFAAERRRARRGAMRRVARNNPTMARLDLRPREASLRRLSPAAQSSSRSDVVKLIGIADVRPGFGANFSDGCGVEAADFGEHRFGSTRRISTARARRSSSGASSR